MPNGILLGIIVSTSFASLSCCAVVASLDTSAVACSTAASFCCGVTAASIFSAAFSTTSSILFCATCFILSPADLAISFTSIPADFNKLLTFIIIGVAVAASASGATPTPNVEPIAFLL